VWVRKDGGRWRLYDYEDLTIGSRSTNNVVALQQCSLVNQTKAHTAIAMITTADKQLAAGQTDAALATMRSISTEGTPTQVELTRLTTLAAFHLQTRSYREALSDIDSAVAFQADLPLGELIRARAHNMLGESDQAIAATDRYEKALGPDAASYWTRGEALLKKGRRDEALKCFRAGMADRTDSAENLAGLCDALGVAGRAETLKYLDAFPNKRDALWIVANMGVRRHSMTAIDAALDLYQQVDPTGTFTEKHYIMAERAIINQKWEDAWLEFTANQSALSANPLTSKIFLSEYAVVKRVLGRN
jgi:tetratricopeptide (TPR) repeat protein